jgi:peptidoglycan hydrolase CwlO-like protein
MKRRAKKKLYKNIETVSLSATNWIGSVASLIAHTVFFVLCATLVLLGAPLEKVLLMLTTLVSLEAIYLSIFIQMSVNRHAESLREVSEDIEEIQEDVEEIQEDVEGIEKDVDEIQKDVDEISENVDEIQEDVEHIEKDVEEISEDETPSEEHGRFDRIESTLHALQEEIVKLRERK